MKNEEISLKTKQALVQALKQAMNCKPLSKVTVTELIHYCNINRNTFYYHFEDIYDLLKWMLDQEAIEVVKKINLITNTEEAFRFVMKYLDDNQHILNCAYDSMGHEEMKRFLYRDFIGIMKNAINTGEKEMHLHVDEEFKSFLCDFYSEAITGMMITWIKKNQKDDREEVLENLLTVCRVSIPTLLQYQSQKNRG